jgi:hypothetical protein
MIVEIDKKNITDYIDKYEVIVFKLRNSRIKSKQLGILEVLLMNHDLDIKLIKNGPLGDVKGVVSFLINKDYFNILKDRLKYIGYFNEFYILDFNGNDNNTSIETINPLNWKGLDYSLNTLYIQDEKLYEEQSPHNRDFRIISFDGSIKDLKGYRGDGSETGRRALPVEDARCLVNLSMPFNNKKIIEPFAGGGGIVYMYKYINNKVDITSIDIDENLKPGLELYGANHIVSSSADVKLNDMYDAIVTEVPFSLNVLDDINKSFNNLYNNIDNMIVLMCGVDQANSIYNNLSNLDINLLFRKELNRKGTDVEIQIWIKNKEIYNQLKDDIKIIESIY